jgi:GT2 family glycosyltransferase
VILIDQNKVPLKLSSELESHELLDVQRVDTTSVSKARNNAKISLSVEWIIFCDDDGYMDENYSEILSEVIHNNKNTEIFAGSIIRDDNLKFYSPRHAIGGDINKFRNTKLLMGSNFTIKRSTFIRLGMFDENFGTGSFWGSGEESDFAWKAYFKKVPMLYCPELRVLHIKPYEGNTREANQKAFSYGVGKGALITKWLIKNRKIIVLYELLEMFIVPLIKMFQGSIKLDKKLFLTSIYSLKGRCYGLVKSISKIKSTRD